MSARSFSEVIKDQPGADAVHVASAGGDGSAKPAKAKSFKEVVAGCAPGELGKAAQPRALKPIDDANSHSPFPHDPAALGNMREDQVPRFFGALTDADKLPTKAVALSSLTAMQNRVDNAKVDAIRAKTPEERAAPGKKPVVVRMGGRNYIADGHHRLTADWLDGKTTADVAFKDLTPKDEALKAADPAGEEQFGFAEDPQNARVCKVDEGLGLVFGFAIVCKIDGEDYYDLNVDPNGERVPEHIPEDAMLKASADFMANAERPGNDMHRGPDSGEFVFAFPLTGEIAKALGIATQKTGLLVGYKPEPHVLAKYKSGEYTGFSIEGIRIHNEELPK